MTKEFFDPSTMLFFAESDNENNLTFKKISVSPQSKVDTSMVQIDLSHKAGRSGFFFHQKSENNDYADSRLAATLITERAIERAKALNRT